jgi:hypothetical protein
LWPADVDALAQNQLSDISIHERLVEFELPGEVMLSARDSIRLQGTGTEFDQLYLIESIDRYMHPHGGFVERIRAKNASQSVP